MNRFQLFKELRRHRKLADKRSIDFEKNKAAKYLVWVMSSLMVVYLIGFAIMFSLIINSSESTTSLEFICGIMPFLFVIDFFFRFMMQQTPAQMIKPYVLMPIYRYACIDNFMATSIFSSGNLVWFCMLLPYALMSVVFSYGLWATILMLVYFWLIFVLSSQCYTVVRTLINNTMLWWALPIGVLVVIALPWIIGGFDTFFDIFASSGRAFENGNPLPLLIVLCLLAAVICLNRHLQYVNIWRELSRTEKTEMKTITRFDFLERYGEIGQYIQLEIKSIMRNKNPRKGFITATLLVFILSIIIALTEVYDSPLMTNFWCIYNFIIYGSMLLTRIMCNEGNYIDCLMVRKENILSLFHAKYYLSCAILVLPFVLMLPPVIAGKWSLLMLISYGIFTAGFQYFLLFQMAVYNKVTVPLNTKFIGKGGMENNYFQVLIQLGAFFVPIIFVQILQAFFGNTVSYIVMLLIGLAFIATYRRWLRNIYRRMMLRRYENMEGFRATR